mmetsp:Transcript_20834/g.34365  ORF Transcript_20834/g.34365 Transcript_20834/m.34365 type:complete len:334 (+) Transcript_20834:108-1109(+)
MNSAFVQKKPSRKARCHNGNWTESVRPRDVSSCEAWLLTCWPETVTPLYPKGPKHRYLSKCNSSASAGYVRWCSADNATAILSEAFAHGRLQNHTLIFLGDSITTQHYLATVCRLRAFAPLIAATVPIFPIIFRATESIWLNCVRFSPPLHHAVCLIQGLSLSPPLGPTLASGPGKGLARVLRAATNGTRALVVANIGLHIHAMGQLAAVVRSTLAAFQRLPSNIKPTVIWRETSAQHFKTRNGLYASNVSLAPTCLPTATPTDFYNNVTNAVVASFGVPILPIWAPSVSRWHDHPDGGRDCTHWCMGTGLVDSWVDLLYALLPTVVSLPSLT